MKKIIIIVAFFVAAFFIFFDINHPINHNKRGNLDGKNVAILYIATGRYITFWDEFYPAMEKYFLPNHKKTYFIFTDDTVKTFPNNVIRVYQEQLPWPNITLYRYRFFQNVASQLKDFDYIFFLNGNLIPQRIVDEEILPNRKQRLMFTEHPGFYNFQGLLDFPYDRNAQSKAFVPENEGSYYVMGGFWGGVSDAVLEMIHTLNLRTDEDASNGIVARWHDESHLNRYLIDYMKNGGNPLILTPQYAVPEETLINPAAFLNLNVFKRNPYMIILDKSRRGGHHWLRGQSDNRND